MGHSTRARSEDRHKERVWLLHDSVCSAFVLARRRETGTISWIWWQRWGSTVPVFLFSTIMTEVTQRVNTKSFSLLSLSLMSQLASFVVKEAMTMVHCAVATTHHNHCCFGLSPATAPNAIALGCFVSPCGVSNDVLCCGT